MGHAEPGSRPAGPRASHAEAGSIALLLPAAVLVLVVLGAIAVDLALVQGGQRRLVDLAGAIATDAHGRVDVDAAFAAGEVRVDRVGAQRLADRATAAAVAADPRLVRATCRVASPTGEVVAVTCRGVVEPLVGRGLPGAGPRTVTATDRAGSADTDPRP